MKSRHEPIRWTSVPGPDTIARRELPNGVIALASENRASPSVVIEGRVWVDGLVSRAQAGLPNFVREMLTRGTVKRDFATIAETVESAGASFGFDSDWFSTSFSGRCLAEDLPLLLEIIADCLRQPTFPADQVDKVRGEILTSLEQRAYDTRRMAMLTFYETLYEGQPIGISSHGYHDSVSALSRADLVKFYQQRYGPERMIVAVVGAVPAERALIEVEQVLGDWQRQTPAAPLVIPPAVRPLTMRRREITIPGKSQADLVLGNVGLMRNHPDYFAARLANTILGVFGMMGRIGENVRERQGLAYYAYSALAASLAAGPWMAIAGVHPDNVERAVQSILDEMRRLQDEPVPEDELADNKSYLIGSMPLTLETNDGIAATLEAMEAYNLGLDYLQRYPALIEAVTAEDVQRVARTYLDTEAYTLAIARPEGAVGD